VPETQARFERIRDNYGPDQELATFVRAPHQFAYEKENEDVTADEQEVLERPRLEKH
jgi:hypothetical protein